MEGIENYRTCYPVNQTSKRITSFLEDLFEKDYKTFYLYCDLLKNYGREGDVDDFIAFEKVHRKLIIIMEALNEIDSVEEWCRIFDEYQIHQNKVFEITKKIKNDLINNILHQS